MKPEMIVIAPGVWTYRTESLVERLMDDRITVAIPCVECHRPQEIKIRPGDVERYKAGEGSVQSVFPYLTASEREMFLSRICGTCWDRLFKEEDDT